MDTSKFFAVEYNPRLKDWRIDTLDEVLLANYDLFLRILRVNYEYFLEEGKSWHPFVEVDKSKVFLSRLGEGETKRKGADRDTQKMLPTSSREITDRPSDWLLLGVCPSLKEAKALVRKFEEIKDRLVQDMQEIRRSAEARYT